MSNFTGIKNAVQYLWSKGYALPLGKIICKFFSGNSECPGEECPYSPEEIQVWTSG
ncbi:MAG: hypothetical protein ACUVWJ_08775 [Spirochaetota bacterium]